MVELMQHQKDAVRNLATGKILYGGVGTGKSLTAIAYYVEKESPKDIYIITTAKKRDSLDWQGEAAKFGIGSERNATLHGKVVVDSWNNISKYIKIEDAFFIFDEQRVVGTGTWVRSFYEITKRNNWILLSATPGDTWLDYIPVFVANGLYKNATQFKREHVVYATYSKYPKVVRYLGTAVLEKYRNMLLVEMPYKKHTVRHIEEVYLDYDEDNYQKVMKDRWHIYEDRPIKDAGELFRMMRKVVASSPERLNYIRELLSVHRRIIIFYNFDYELEILRTLADEVPLAEWNGHRKQPIPDTENWVYLVQYVSGAEGWNCISTDTMVFYSLTYSYKNFVQSQGRIDRLDTKYTNLHYFVLTSRASIEGGIRQSLDEKETFNERDWARKNGISIDFEVDLEGSLESV
jgi:hypothetical protein